MVDINELPLSPFSEKAGPATDFQQTRTRSLLGRLVDEYHENYCPRRAPDLILPSPPTDEEKYAFANMNRTFLITCGFLVLATLFYGGVMFARSAPVFTWYAVYILISDLYIFASLFITFFGKSFDISAHKNLLEEIPLTKETAPTVDVYLPVCKEPIEVVENTCKYLTTLYYPSYTVYILDDGADEAIESLAEKFSFE